MGGGDADQSLRVEHACIGEMHDRPGVLLGRVRLRNLDQRGSLGSGSTWVARFGHRALSHRESTWAGPTAGIVIGHMSSDLTQLRGWGTFLLSSSTAADSLLSVRPEPMRPSGRTRARRSTPSCGRADCLSASSLQPCICLLTRGLLTRRIRVRAAASATRPCTTSIVDGEYRRGARPIA